MSILHTTVTSCEIAKAVFFALSILGLRQTVLHILAGEKVSSWIREVLRSVSNRVLIC